MSLLRFTCNHCHAEIQVPLGAVLAVRLEDDDLAGVIAYLCDACGEFVDERVTGATLDTLATAGCTVGSVWLRQS